MSVIVCGSKKYKNRNFDELVDSFEVIVRSNMLLPDMGYGKRDSTIQVCNNHVYDHYQRKAEVDELKLEIHKLYLKIILDLMKEYESISKIDKDFVPDQLVEELDKKLNILNKLPGFNNIFVKTLEQTA